MDRSASSGSSDEDEDEDEISIIDFLYDRMEDSSFLETPGMFFPADAIETMFTTGAIRGNDCIGPRQRILKLLHAESNAAQYQSLVDFILTRARRTFLICLFVDERRIRAKMIAFMKHGFDDDQLPIQRLSLKEYRLPDSTHILCMDRRLWPFRCVSSFQDQQWRFLAPIFSTTTLLHDFGQRTMPFISSGASSLYGAFSTVTRYTVHPAHFDSPQETSPASCVIAVKKFKRDRDQADRTSHWENEVRVLEKMKCLGHDHIVRFLTAFRHGEGEGQSLDHYICFEWASGGNLADLWDEDPQPRLSGPLIRSVVQQLRGLAQALNAIHYFRGPDGETTEASFIHGDIKPKNILWFRDGGEIGTLKLADWGEATVYGADGDKANTATRHNTTGKLGTRRYEPPEVETGLNIDDSGITKIGRSRLYDTWSFGCFSLEFIIWLLHGTEGLKKFRHDSVGDYGLADSFYEINHERRAKVHGVVTYWIDHLEKDALCKYESSALGDLLDIVRNGLLVVKLPQGGGGSRTQVKTYPRFILQGQDKSEDERTKHISHETVTVEYVSVADGMPTIVITNAPSSLVHQNDAPLSVAALERFRAVELVENLDRVCQKNQSDQYWFQAAPRCPMPPKYRNRTSLVKIPRQVRGNYDCPDLDPEDWQFRLDNEFAVKIFEQLVASDVLPPASPAHVTDHLCDKCRDFQGDVWSPFFSMTYETELLYQNTASRSCDLCALLSRVCQDNASATHSSVGFERRNSTIRMTNVRLPVLSLFCDYNPNSIANDIQTGFSKLPKAGTALHLEVLRGWLDHCDNEHWKDPKCKPSRFKKSAAGSIIRPPTRLIAVGTAADKTVKLQEMKDLEGGNWIALSYQWGSPPHFSTTRSNISDMYGGVEVDKLPQTFRDAITITRALKTPYLWIDSICIVQGPDGDFESEAITMEDVYNGASCVLAACCAEGQASGFLTPRMDRHQVTLDSKHQNYGTIHVCQTIDNFEKHVLNGDLAKRGWVLQEHALARRTIFFTKYQTYWECGHGIRCETMATLVNEHASLLGDPDFPKRLEPAEHGEFFVRLQELLKQYSRLGLSKDHDRSTAIASLQQRLMRVMNLQGGYGIFDSSDNPGLLRRSLLWHRSLDVKSLTTITYPKRYEVPSWSWMSCSGPIDYFPLTFYGFDWQSLELTWSDTKVADGKTRLGATVLSLDLTAANPFEADIIFDIPAKVDEEKMMAVVLGVEKGDAALGDKKHYILVVTPKAAWGHALYGRVGAGHVPGRCLVGQPEVCLLI